MVARFSRAKCVGLALVQIALATNVLAQATSDQPAPSQQAQPPQAAGPADVARAFAAAEIRHDHAAAAAYVTDKSRADFMALMGLSDRARAARVNLQTAIDQKFKTQEARRVRVPLAAAAVLTAEVAGQRQIDPNTVELNMRLYTATPTQPTVNVTWHAVRENGQWKIELPQCATPEASAPLKARLTEMSNAADKLTTSIKAGEFSSVQAARTALINAGRLPIMVPRQ
jgi:hypothetical protein